MPRPSQAHAKRADHLPVIARAFAELGYRRMTTAELASRCRVRENVLYRLWPDKKAMFIAAIDYVYDLSARTWDGLLDSKRTARSARQLLEYEARHLGEFGHSRIIFAGLGETDDADIRRALARMYRHYQRFVSEQVRAHRGATGKARGTDTALAAWALVGLGTVSSIVRELDLLPDRERRRLMVGMGTVLLGGRPG